MFDDLFHVLVPLVGILVSLVATLLYAYAYAKRATQRHHELTGRMRDAAHEMQAALARQRRQGSGDDFGDMDTEVERRLRARQEQEMARPVNLRPRRLRAPNIVDGGVYAETYVFPNGRRVPKGTPEEFVLVAPEDVLLPEEQLARDIEEAARKAGLEEST